MVIGIAILLLAPFVVFLLPNFIANTIYFKAGSWFIFVSFGVYMVYAVAFIFLIAAFFVLYAMNMNKKSIVITIGLMILACTSFYIASLNYTMLSDDRITYRPLLSFQTYSYTWSEVDEAVFRSVHADDGNSEFDFKFDDDVVLTLTMNRLFMKFLPPIENRLSHEGVEVEKILIPKKE
ncbi:hypothetical protein DVB69_09835 [Sporosarcina sp. BI001-red]|uniref:hypothetical protein n=1 Tax=Sporosarcina sp. BI001-red TaxID=2282866 RepID=UPI000E254ABB|nr:hypothetical protein [Sporosarcina sp. BI001-red]REB07145.1 hypothetical protein DVB69_09835 [Sporosarcina sp. BI001-red]